MVQPSKFLDGRNNLEFVLEAVAALE